MKDRSQCCIFCSGINMKSPLSANRNLWRDAVLSWNFKARDLARSQPSRGLIRAVSAARYECVTLNPGEPIRSSGKIRSCKARGIGSSLGVDAICRTLYRHGGYILTRTSRSSDWKTTTTRRARESSSYPLFSWLPVTRNLRSMYLPRRSVSLLYSTLLSRYDERRTERRVYEYRPRKCKINGSLISLRYARSSL